MVTPDVVTVFDELGKSIGEFNVKAGKFDTSKLKSEIIKLEKDNRSME